MVEVRDQHGVLIVDEVDGHIQGNTVFKRVVLYLSSSAVDDVKATSVLLKLVNTARFVKSTFLKKTFSLSKSGI